MFVPLQLLKRDSAVSCQQPTIPAARGMGALALKGREMSGTPQYSLYFISIQYHIKNKLYHYNILNC